MKSLFDVVEEAMQTIIGHLKFAFEITGKPHNVQKFRNILLKLILGSIIKHPLFIEIIKVRPMYKLKFSIKNNLFFNPGGLFGKITEEDLKTTYYQASTTKQTNWWAFI